MSSASVAPIRPTESIPRVAMEWGLILAALLALTTTEGYTPYVTAGLICLLVAFILRAVRSRHVFPHTGMELPLLLFLVSGLISLWAAYDRATAGLQLIRLLAVAVIFFELVDSPKPFPVWAAIALVVAAAGLALYWPLKHDFASQPMKFAPLTAAGLWLNRLMPSIPGPTVHPNVAAGTLAIALPVGIGLSWIYLRKKSWLPGMLVSGLSLAILAGLVLTSSRGAWLAVVAGAGVALLGWVQLHWFKAPRQKFAYWLAVILISFAGAVLLTLGGYTNQLLGQLPGPTGALQSRYDLWGQGLMLAKDYLFTGAGMLSFNLVNAIYGYLIHVLYIAHAHNLPLEVLVEQGILGLIALAWIGLVLLTWAWRTLDADRSSRRSVSAEHVTLGLAGLVAMFVTAVHGIFDIVFYVERTLPIIGLVLGFAWLGVGDRSSTSQKLPVRVRLLLAAGLLAILAVGLVIFRQTIISAWYANLAAVAQNRVELNTYSPLTFDKLSLDQVRRQVDLSAAQAYFDRALAHNPQNLTALQRLAQIELSQGRYEQGLTRMKTAWQAGARDEITRLVYGDALVANGNPETAGEVLSGVPWARSRLHGQAWARYWVNGDFPRAADAWRTVLLLDPTDQVARENLAAAEEKIP